MYKYRFVPEAKAELRKEIAYSKKTQGVAHAQRYKDGLMLKVNNICKNPMIYQLQNDLLIGLRICIYKGNKILFFADEMNKTVIILGFLSKNQSLDNINIKKRKYKPC